jgi:hypothetical protein
MDKVMIEVNYIWFATLLYGTEPSMVWAAFLLPYPMQTA